jgi:hypothetical protein
VCLGSCFSEEIGKKFLEHGFNVLINPFGVIFNPISISNIILDALEKTNTFRNHVIATEGAFHSLFHHGSFTSSDLTKLLHLIEQQNEKLRNALTEASFLFLTLGTANVYKWKASGETVANCHKLPQHLFEKHRLDIDECVIKLQTCLQALFAINPELKVVFTVSPVRYLSFGIHENQLSKATLLLSIERVISENANCFYFPAYELVIDDLRDYRFMKEDLIHPNDQAVSYLWEKLADAFFNEDTRQLGKRVSQYFAMKNHRLSCLNSEAARNFQKKIDTEKKAIKELLPHAEL